jgi:uncharacterized protein DUF3307
LPRRTDTTPASGRPEDDRDEYAVQMILLAMVVFQIKHFVFDFVLQPYRLVVKKGIYLHPAGLLHAGGHMLGSIPAMLILTRAPLPITVLALGEFVLHYHADWMKARVDGKLGLNHRHTLYWAIFGADQLIHQLTYVGMIYAILFLF